MENQSPPSQQVRAHVIVSGTVQGVGYRLSIWDKANQWGINGWVQDLPDGRVEAVFEGIQELVKAIVRWCYRGSPDSVIKNVAVEYEEPEGLKEFIIKRSKETPVLKKPVNVNIKTVNVLSFVPGFTLGNLSLSEEKQYEELWEPVKNLFNLSQRIDRVVRVHWHQSFSQVDEFRLNEQIHQAQKFVAEQVNWEKIRQNPSPNNLILSSAEKDIDSQPWWRFLSQTLRQNVLLRGYSESVYYSSIEGKIAVQVSVYDQILQALEKYRQQIAKDLEQEELTVKVRLHFISQGLETTVINDFLHGLFSATGNRMKKHPEQAKEPDIITSNLLQREKQETVEHYQFWQQAARGKRLEVGSIVSMASQLPLFMLRSQRVIERFAQGETLPADEIGIPPDVKEIIWKNFYDLDDLLAFPVRGLFGEHPGIQDIQVEVGNSFKGQKSFWNNPDIHEHVAELLHRRVVS